MGTHKPAAHRLAWSFGLLLCSLSGSAAADDALVTPAQIVMYCEARTGELAPDERELAAVGCRILAAGAAESLARKDLAGAFDQLRALDERMRRRVAPPEPVRCPATPECAAAPMCPAPPEAIVCPAPRPPRIASATPTRHRSGGIRDPFGDSPAPLRSTHTMRTDPVTPPKPVERPSHATPKKHPARDLMDPFPAAWLNEITK